MSDLIPDGFLHRILSLLHDPQFIAFETQQNPPSILNAVEANKSRNTAMKDLVALFEKCGLKAEPLVSSEIVSAEVLLSE